MATQQRTPVRTEPNDIESRPVARDYEKGGLSFLRLKAHRFSSSRVERISDPNAASPRHPLSPWKNYPTKAKESPKSAHMTLSLTLEPMARLDDAPDNIMGWMAAKCPPEVLPKMLAYCGPQSVADISRINRFWRHLIQQESTWRTMCEDLYKWKPTQEEPKSWKEYYRLHPCVPIDYPTVHRAIQKTAKINRLGHQTRKVCVLLRPGKHYLKEAVTVHAASENVHVELATMDVPECVGYMDEPDAEESTDSPSPVAVIPPVRSPVRRLRDILTCRHVEGVDPTVAGPLPSLPPALLFEGFDRSARTLVSGNANHRPKRASLVLRTRRANEPLLRIRQGTCIVRNVELVHISQGIDIWNGNAAVQIQPPPDANGNPDSSARPEALLENVEVRSFSGRGIVNIDGGQLTIRNGYIHDCAATGIYVGGPGSRASIHKTDVVKNGFGNRYHRRGVARGHSGIYLEQGNATVSDCNVSRNSLTGISAVSYENAILNLEDSELVSNGSFQLEMPPPNTVARRASMTQNNVMANFGIARSRSGLVMEEVNNA